MGNRRLAGRTWSAPTFDPARVRLEKKLNILGFRERNFKNMDSFLNLFVALMKSNIGKVKTNLQMELIDLQKDTYLEVVELSDF